MATSLDGFVAKTDGSVEWLDPFHSEELGFADFLAEIGSIVTGRTTYEQVLGFGEWPYGGKRVMVLSERPLGKDAPAEVERYQGALPELVRQLRDRSQGDIWILGGARVAQQMLNERLVDTVELSIIPVLIGSGIRLFEDLEPAALQLESIRSFRNGVVVANYRCTRTRRPDSRR